MPAANRAALAAGLFSLFGLLAGSPAFAADARGQYGIRGAGLVSCAVYERERAARSPAYQVIAGWIDGYITGRNQYAPDTYDTLSFESTEMIAAVISENCKKQPDAVVFAVLNGVLEQIADDRLRKPSKKVNVSIGARSVQLYQETVRRLQKKLAEGGFYDGPIDGAFGAGSQEALGRYQASVKLEPTGFPDQVTLWHIFRSTR